MKVLIELSIEHYDLLVAEWHKAPREYAILKNSIVAQDPATNPDRRIVKILCDEDEAISLMNKAITVYPNVAGAIGAAIDLARKLDELFRKYNPYTPPWRHRST